MNKNNIDLNIDNYNINDLLLFLGLKKNYTAIDLDNKEKEYILNVVSDDTNSITPQKKYDIITFIKNAKSILFDNINSNNKPTAAATAATPNAPSAPNAPNAPNIIQIGDVINPRSNIPAMQFSRNAIAINGYHGKTTTRNYVFNTVFRDNFYQTYSTNSTYTLPQKMTNVLSIDLSALQFPNYMFTFSKANKTNQIYIEEEETGNYAWVTIPSGNYDFYTFPPMLSKAINEQVVGTYDPSGPNRFEVTISASTFFTTISNTTYNFFIVASETFYNDDPNNYVCPNIYSTRYFKTNLDPAVGERPEQTVNSLAWLIGYRLPAYGGEKSYTSEGLFDNTYADYVYFTLNDYVNNQTANTYGMLQNSILDNNLLAVIPITAPQFVSTFSNNANFIYKTRLYNGPVNITKINIGLINEFGEQLNLHNSNFAFCLQVTSMFDPV
jgi:hypothetical protein